MRHLLLLAGMAIGLTACQQNAYKIVGSTQGYNDGDTILLVNTSMEPTDTLIIKEGKFELSGKVDSVVMAIAYPQKNQDDAVLFFIEPGTVKISLTGNSKTSKVGGTKANDGLQALTDKSIAFEEQMEQLTMLSYDSTLTDEKRLQINEEYTRIQMEMPQMFIDAAEQNIDNEFGFFVVTNLAPTMAADKVQELISKMPSQFRERKAVKDLEAMLSPVDGVGDDMQMEDFSMATPEGEELSVMDVVEQNRLTILDFWASWCQPCVREMPVMVELYERFHEKGLGIIGISLDENHDQWTKAIKTLGMTWPQISDLKGWNSHAAEMFHVQAIPHMIVVNSSGNILKSGLRGEALESFIAGQLE